MKYSIHEFASEIRKLYPGDYDDLSDNKLVELWLKKYPKDIEKINLVEDTHYNTIKSQIGEKQKIIVYHKFIWGRQILIGIATIFFLYYSFISNPTEDDFLKAMQNKYMTDSKQNGIVGNFLGGLGTAMDVLLNDYRRTDLVLGSFYTKTTNGKTNIVAIGFWKNIFFLDSNPPVQQQQQPTVPGAKTKKGWASDL